MSPAISNQQSTAELTGDKISMYRREGESSHAREREQEGEAQEAERDVTKLLTSIGVERGLRSGPPFSRSDSRSP